MDQHNVSGLPKNVEATSHGMASLTQADPHQGIEAIGAPEDRKWLEWQDRLPFVMSDACARGATALLNVLAIFLSAHLALLGFKHATSVVYLLPEGIWFVCLGLVWLVLTPREFGYWPGDAVGIADGFARRLGWRLLALRIAAILTPSGLLAAIFCGIPQ